MKKVYSILSILLTIALIGTLVSCEKDQEVMLTAVSVTNEQITPMYNSATISSTISSEATIREVFVQYAVTKDFAEYDEVSMQEIDGRYTAELLDLQDNTIYYYRYAASNRHSAIVLKTIHQFETLKPTVPTISLDTILTVWDSYAQVQITLSFDGGANVSEMGVCWGTNPEPTPEDNVLQTKDTVAVLNISTLEPNTQYYVRAYATNKIGVGYSQTYTFTTFALPQVQSNDITDVQLTSAMLNGLLLSDGNDTAVVVGFCWSENEEPTISDTLQIVEIKDNIFSYYLSNLKDETQYFVRAFAQNRIGVAYGEVKAFTTASTVIPTVLTTAATQVTTNSAVVGGNVTDDGGAEVTERGVVYSTNQNPTTADTKVTSGSGVGEFTCDLTNLQPNTTYYVRAYAINKKGTAYGEEVSFATNKQIVLPSITTNAITQITETSAVAGGNVTSDGNASVTERGIVYSTNPNPVITNLYNTIKPCGSGTGSFTCELTNLQPNTTYYVRAYATNEKGTAYGEEVSFATNKNIVLPSLITNIITQITETTAVAGGNVTSDGNASVTERGVVYSTNPNPVITNLYHTIKPCGSGTGSFTCDLTNLQPNTTYYVRAYATNSMGTAYGEEVSFTTEEEVVAIPEYVDLGLSVKWATFNVGATKPEEYGDYFAWGETEPKEKYDWSTYKWCNGTDANMTKYNATDRKIILELEDDAAYMNWGGNWRIPTIGEMIELSNQCTWTVINKNGVNGYKITSKSNSNSIFIPFAGYYNGSLFTDVDINGYYWSSVLQPNGHPNFAWRVCMKGFTTNTDNKCLGHSIRPVYGEYIYITYNTPTITTNIPTQITSYTAVAGGNVTSDGNASVTERGVVYSTNPNPVITNLYNTIKPCGSGTGSFTCDLTNLQPNTTYYVRAYATNEVGTAYGEEMSFTTETPAVHEYVDLGLSVKWATCNVGASKPEEYGDYFAWGEIESKEVYDWSTYKWCNGSETITMLIKYNEDSSYGTKDNKTRLDLSDDAARANWGGDWRMPTDAELIELIEQCTWTWTTQNGVNGYKVTSKSNDNSIFLPAAGAGGSWSLDEAGSEGYYWSSSLNNTGNSYLACFMSFAWNHVSWDHGGERCFAYTVRPVWGEYVMEETVPTIITTTVTQITETSAVAGGNVISDGGTSVTEKGVVYGKSPNPTISNLSNTIRPCGSGIGEFTYNMTDLQPSTTYYVRAYATNKKGTAYGEEVSFTTQEQVSPPFDDTENGYGYVDLGLSVKWATCNVGADTPEEYGDYFAWGETEPKETYDDDNYKWFTSGLGYTKYYNGTVGTGILDNRKTMEPSDDAATVNWGGNWRVPTREELTELETNCTWTLTTQSGISGYRVTSKKAGYTNKSIFIPLAGKRGGYYKEHVGELALYWSSSLYLNECSSAFVLYNDECINTDMNRYNGLTIRPVYGPRVEEVIALPTVITHAVTALESDYALIMYEILDDGGSNITDAGVVYGLSTNPTILDNKVSFEKHPNDKFECDLYDLQPNTTYYVRAYATNEMGTAYGEEISFTTKGESNTPSNGTENGYAYVDLGLSVKWATMNVGASSPEEYGDYFAWGEIEPKEVYDWSTYKYCNGSKTTLTKYCTDSYYGTVDNKTTLELSDDAARANWGGSWRMPTKAEQDELRNNCTWTWTTQNGVYGYYVTSKKNDNSIFLPAAGRRLDSSLDYAGSNGYYWSSSLDTPYSYYACYLDFYSSNVDWYYNNRNCGFSVRPVYQ